MFKTPVFFGGGGVALSKLTNILGFVIIHCWHLQPVFHRMTGSGGTLLLVESLWGKSLRSTLSFVNARFGLLDGEMSLPSPAPQKVQGNLYNYGEFLAFSCISSMNPPQKWPERPSWWWKKSAMTAPRQFVCRWWCPLRWYILISHCILYISYNHYTP